MHDTKRGSEEVDEVPEEIGETTNLLVIATKINEQNEADLQNCEFGK